MSNRELAWRVFAGEYNATTLEFPPEEERGPGYIVTPLGAKINRIHIVGVLTDIEKLERNGNTHYRARISDRTGVFYIYAGQYDPEAVKILSKLEPPKYIAVSGKSRLYSPEEGTTYVSIRPEQITVVDKDIRDYWLLETSKSMKMRLEAFVEASEMETPDVEKLTKLGFDPVIITGILDAMKHYKQPDIKQYHNMLIEVLRYLVVENGEGYITTENTVDPNLENLPAEFKTGDELTEQDSDPEFELEFEPAAEQDTDLDNSAELEEQLLKIISEYDGNKSDQGIPWHGLVEAADKAGIDNNLIEDLVNGLLDRGQVYEPILGRIKCSGVKQ
jgi:RPA family protein